MNYKLTMGYEVNIVIEQLKCDVYSKQECKRVFKIDLTHKLAFKLCCYQEFFPFLTQNNKLFLNLKKNCTKTHNPVF